MTVWFVAICRCVWRCRRDNGALIRQSSSLLDHPRHPHVQKRFLVYFCCLC